MEPDRHPAQILGDVYEGIHDQSDDMYDALRHARKTVEFVKLKKEDHWLSSSDTRLQMLQATVEFLKKHNPPD